MERRARSRRHPRDRRERRGGVRSRAPLARRTSETFRTASRRSRISTPAPREWSGRSTRCAAAATPTSASTSPARRSARSSCGSTLRTTPTTREADTERLQPALRRGRDPHGGVSPRTERRAGRPPVRARARERAQRGERAHVGRARNDARRARDARVDRRAALARRLDGERRRASEPAGRRRTVDAALRRQRAAAARRGPRRRRKPARAPPGLARSRTHATSREMLERTAVVEGPLANWPTATRASSPTARSACSGATAHRGSSSPRPRTCRRSSSSPARSSPGRRAATGKGPGSATAPPATATRS